MSEKIENSKLEILLNKLTSEHATTLNMSPKYIVPLLRSLAEEVKEHRSRDFTPTKPDFPCVVVARSKHDKGYEYTLYLLEMVDGETKHGIPCRYLGLLDPIGVEIGDLDEDLTADEYLVLERTEK